MRRRRVRRRAVASIARIHFARKRPLSNRIPEWLALTARGQFLEAAALSRSTSNLPEICSRVCPQERLCEGSCILNSKSDPVAIGAIERFINDYAFAHHAVDVPLAAPNGLSVAVIGSGPGGIACADELAKLGYNVTVFESLLIPGGLLVNGIPAFKLEKHLVERRIDLLAKRGVKFRLGVRVGWDVTLAELRRDFTAVFLGVGSVRSHSMYPAEHYAALCRRCHFSCRRMSPGRCRRFSPG